MDPDPEGTEATHTQRPPANIQAGLHPSGSDTETHTQRSFRQQLDSLRAHPAARSGPVPQEPGQVRICGDATPPGYGSDPTHTEANNAHTEAENPPHTVANNQLRAYEDDQVAADEADDDEVDYTITRGRSSRKTRQRHTSATARDAAQVSTTSAARPTTTAGREAL